MTKTTPTIRYELQLLRQRLCKDDEDLDFLSADSIEFGDGSVIAAPAATQAMKPHKEAEPLLLTATQKPNTLGLQNSASSIS